MGKDNGAVNPCLQMMPGYLSEHLHKAGAEGKNRFDVQVDTAAFIKKNGEL